jgi:hypothetical protein
LSDAQDTLGLFPFFRLVCIEEPLLLSGLEDKLSLLHLLAIVSDRFHAQPLPYSYKRAGRMGKGQEYLVQPHERDAVIRASENMTLWTCSL